MREQLKQYLTWEADYRTGETLPQVGVGTPTATAMAWGQAKGRGVYIPANSTTSKIDYGAVDPLGVGNVTIIAVVKLNAYTLSTNAIARVITNGKTIVGLVNATTNGYLTITSNDATQANSATRTDMIGNTFCLAVTRTSTGVANLFVNGTQSGTRNQSSGTPVAGSANLVIGNQVAGSRQFEGIEYYIAVYNTILTEQQIAQISDELMNEKSITLPFQRTQQDVNLLVDGDMEWGGTTWWTGGNNATITKQTTTPYKGTQCIRLAYTGPSSNPYMTPTHLLSANKSYRITGKVRGDGTAIPRLYCNNASTILATYLASTTWQNIDILYQPASADLLRIYTITAIAGYSEWDDMKIVEVPSTSSYQSLPKDTYVCGNGIGWNRSFANETGGMLSNTGFRVISGSWQVENQGDMDERKKQITCKNGGVLSIPLSVPYGYWKFDLYKGADGNNTIVNLLATLSGAYTATGNNGYIFAFNSSEVIIFQSIVSGVGTTRMSSASSYISTTGWYSVIVKRYPSGVFYTYIKGGSQFPTWTLVDVTGGSGTNPFTNNTYTTSQFLNLQFGTGDAIKNIEVSSDFNKLLVNNQI